MRELKQSTAATIMILMVDATDDETAETGKTLTVYLSKNGGAFATSTNAAAEVSGGSRGWYSLALTATEVNTIGELVVEAEATGCDIWRSVYSVVAAIPDANMASSSAGAIVAATFAAGAITAAAIAADAITAAKVADGAIDAGAIATGAITNAKFAAGAIDAAAIADNAIDAGAIATGAITNAKFAAGAIDAAAIADNAIDAGAIADNAIDAGAIATGALTSAKFGAGAITSTVLADNAITSSKLAAGAITAAAIATGAVDADAIATDAVNEIQNGLALSSALATVGSNVLAVKTATDQLAFSSGDVVATLAGEGVAVSDKTGFKLASDGLDSISITPASGVATNFREMFIAVWRLFFKKVTETAAERKTYADNGTTVWTTQPLTDDGTTQTQGAAT